MSKRLLLAVLFVFTFFSVQVLSQKDLNRKIQGFDPKKAERDIKLPHELEEDHLQQNPNKITDYYRTTEQLLDMWDGAVWVPQYKYLYEFDENNNETGYTTLKWNGSDWDNYYKDTYSYDNGNITAYTYQHWNGSEWLNDYRYSYVYDAFGYYTTYTVQLGDSLAWVNSYRYVYYQNDATHDIDSLLYQSWNVSSWEDLQKYIYIYNSQGQDSIITSYTWTGTEWVNSFRTIHSYDSSTPSYNYIYQTWSGTEWVNYGRYIYDIDSNHTLGYTNQNWDGTAWVNDYRSVYSYNGEGLQTGDLTQEWDGTVWVNKYRYVYSYTAEGWETEYLFQEWDGAAWVNINRYVYDYDSNGNYTLYKYQEYTLGNWEDSYQYLYEYDENGNTIRYTYQTWDGTLWINNYRYSYIYELVAGVEDGIIAGDFHLYNNYPNPFNPSTKIEFSIPQKSNVVIKIYNILGKEVATLINGEIESGLHSVNFSAINLSSGVYFYKIEVISLDGGSLFSETKKMMFLK